ncbi:hypothetical protein, partial [Anaerorhabdus sp.]|uniref:hypothetical protein n=1 Tax=Anaerorhabdus sp. TaxID=1872524 RepID=UPI002FC85FBD
SSLIIMNLLATSVFTHYNKVSPINELSLTLPQIKSNNIDGFLANRVTSITDDVLIDSYKHLRNNPEVTGQAHHLNQDAVFKNLIPKNEGMSVELKGSVLQDVGSQHYNAHKSLEAFWNKYRTKGILYGEVPTITEYNSALYQSLMAAGFSEVQAQKAVQSAINQQLQHGLKNDTFVPRIPGKINLPE